MDLVRALVASQREVASTEGRRVARKVVVRNRAFGLPTVYCSVEAERNLFVVLQEAGEVAKVDALRGSGALEPVATS
jgi:hypothetical protein